MIWQKTGSLDLFPRAPGGKSTLKSVFMPFMLPLADQGENLQNVTSFCRTIIELQDISGKVQFKACNSPHLIWSPLFLVGISEGLPVFCALSRSRRQQGQKHNFGNQRKKKLEEVSSPNIEQF